MQSFETIEDAVRVANEIISGKMEPHLGCGLIAAVGEKNNYPTQLQMFELLAHEQDSHEHLGITKAATSPHIINACHELIASQA